MRDDDASTASRFTEASTTTVRVHVYDLVDSPEYREALTGARLPVGSGLIALNSGTSALHFGAFHAGVELCGVEWSFGACAKGSGVYASPRAPGRAGPTTRHSTYIRYEEEEGAFTGIHSS